jgi:hypothetical protein
VLSDTNAARIYILGLGRGGGGGGGGGGGLSWGAGAKECFLFGPTKQNSPLPYLMNELEKKFDKAMEQGIFCSGIH